MKDQTKTLILAYTLAFTSILSVYVLTVLLKVFI